MAEDDHDDLADALSRLAGGDVAPSEREHDAVPPPAPQVSKAAFRPTAPPAARPPAPRPAAPVAAPPATPARPQRPAAPTVSRPAAPPPPNLTPPADVLPDVVVNPDVVADDDDDVLVPAPDASVFLRKTGTTAEARARVARAKKVEFRRTLIPVLLNGGVLLAGAGLLPVLMGAESIAARLPGWVTPTLIGLGGVLLALAVANMLAVRSMLGADASAAGRPGGSGPR